MNCGSVEPLIGAVLDGELDAAQLLDIQEHLEQCSSCQNAYREFEQLQKDIRAAQHLFYRAPASLAGRVHASLTASSSGAPTTRAASYSWKWLAVAASVLLAFSVGLNVFSFRRGFSEDQLIAQEVMSDHVRSMLTNRQVDVISSDRHTVKPWFGDKLDFSPEVRDLSPQGFPLIGGRVDYIHQRPVAALVFHRAKHVINLFTWPSNSHDAAAESQNGFHVISWTRDGMTYWAISDLNLDELKQFVQLYKQ
jgi:anti-sigma factor RsiW